MSPLFVCLSFGLINLHHVRQVYTAKFDEQRWIEVQFAEEGAYNPVDLLGDDAVKFLAAIDKSGLIIAGPLPHSLVLDKDLPKKETS